MFMCQRTPFYLQGGSAALRGEFTTTATPAGSWFGGAPGAPAGAWRGGLRATPAGTWRCGRWLI